MKQANEEVLKRDESMKLISKWRAEGTGPNNGCRVIKTTGQPWLVIGPITMCPLTRLGFPLLCLE
jgi:hypothetical protein